MYCRTGYNLHYLKIDINIDIKIDIIILGLINIIIECQT